jgi:uncharacterized protein (DUF58 family)
MARPRTHRFPSRLLKKVFPFTSRGAFILTASAAIFAAGALRTDMAGLFWGASFHTVCLYAAAGSHVMRLIIMRRARAPGFLEVRVPPAVASPGGEAEAFISVAMPRLFLPGFVARARLPLAWHDRCIDGVSAALSPGGNRRRVRFKAEKRGAYAADHAVIEVRDILGFSFGEFSVPLAEAVKVLPRVTPASRTVRTAEEGGDAARFSSRKRRSEELLEARKYFPGDDPRRVNWKVYAHIGELFLRIGEETPPPESRFLFILDTTENPLVPKGISADFLDGLIEACASAMASLMGGGTDLQFLHPRDGKSRLYTRESLDDLLGLLSDAWWFPGGWKPELPSRTRMHAVVFSTPGSPSLSGIMSALKARGWKTSLFLGEAAPPEPRSRPGVGALLRDLILVPAHPRPGRGPRARAERALRPMEEARGKAISLYGPSVIDAAQGGGR